MTYKNDVVAQARLELAHASLHAALSRLDSDDPIRKAVSEAIGLAAGKGCAQ